jgi:hypothetical protein
MGDSGLDAYKVRLEAAAFRLAHEHRVRRLRTLAGVAVIVTTLLVTASTLAATGVLRAWVGGKPAPAEVKRDFAGIRPELGYTPDAKATAEVAREGEIGLYATPTRQGGYCLVADQPSLGYAGDGRGYCLRPEQAKRPFVAGLVGGARDDESGQKMEAVAGRILLDRAATVRLTGPQGDEVERPIGAGGFFVALVIAADIQTCVDGAPWISTLVAIDDEGRELGRARFPFLIPARDTHGRRLRACGIMSPTSDDLAARIIREERLR